MYIIHLEICNLQLSTVCDSSGVWMCSGYFNLYIHLIVFKSIGVCISLVLIYPQSNDTRGGGYTGVSRWFIYLVLIYPQSNDTRGGGVYWSQQVVERSVGEIL